MARTRGRAQGFTLVETLFVAAISAIVVGVIVAAAVAANHSFAVNQARVASTQEARRGLEEMVREAMRAPTSELKDETGANAWPPAGSWSGIQFRYPLTVDDDGEVEDWSETITYTLDTDDRQLVRTDSDGGSRVVANGITALTVKEGDNSREMWVELTTQKTATTNQVMQQPLGVRVRLRNSSSGDDD